MAVNFVTVEHDTPDLFPKSVPECLPQDGECHDSCLRSSISSISAIWSGA